MPSIPALPLLALTRHIASFKFFHSTYLLHHSVGAGWLFGFIPRPGRFSLFPAYLSSFTRRRHREVQLDVLLLVVLEIHDLLASFSFGPLVPVPGLAYLLTPPFGSECLTSFADGGTYYAFC